MGTDDAARRHVQAGRRQVAILAYHKIGPAPGGWETWFYIPEAVFARQLQYLKEHGWAFLDVAAFLSGLDDPESLPRKSALITFDDGYRSLLKHALPALRRLGCPAVLFVPTDYVGGMNGFDQGTEPDEPICGWDELREVQTHGVEVQSHGVTHRAFSELSLAELTTELRSSKRLIEQRLQRPVELFSFPFGDAGGDLDITVASLRMAGYRAACLYGGGPTLLPAPERFRLSRLAMGPDTDLAAALQLASA
jgi:peptidoglycan/xylan/chitin deacetylase (PgdA/CDA1 family)